MGIQEKLFSEEELNQFRIYEGINWKKALKYGALIGGATAAGVALHDYLVKKAAEDAAETIRKHQEQQGKEFAKKGHEYLDKASEEYSKASKVKYFPLYAIPIDNAIDQVCKGQPSIDCVEKNAEQIIAMSKEFYDVFRKRNPALVKAGDARRAGTFDEYVKKYLDSEKHYLNARKYDELAYVYHSAADDAQREVEKAKREFQKQAEQDMYSYKIKNALLSLARKLGF